MSNEPKLPTEPGFYWAKWMLADDNQPEGTKPYKVWEPVEVFYSDVRGLDIDQQELRVNMIGDDTALSIDCFNWGDRMTPPPDVYAALRNAELRDAQRRAVRRYKDMTPDQREEFLQAEQRKRRVIP